MKLTSYDFSFDIDFCDEYIHFLIVKNKKYMRNIISILIEQLDGNDGMFTLSDKDKEISLSKKAYLVTDIFNMPVSTKKILTKISSELSTIATEDIYKSQCLIADIETYVDDLLFSCTYPLIRKKDISIEDIFKVVSLAVEKNEDTLDDLISHCQIIRDLMGIKIFFFLNLSSYLSNNEYMEFVKFLNLNQFNAVFIEYDEKNILEFKTERFNKYVIDEELCEIY